MRGKVRSTQHSVLATGITPAYAGKRLLYRHSTELVQDHPRLCGEKVVGFEYRLSAVGSPPPMRGKEHKG